MADMLNRLHAGAALVVATLCLLPVAAAAEGRRVALVVGNSGYAEMDALDAPTLDAQAMAAALSGLGFEVKQLDNPDSATFQAELSRLSAGLDAGDTAVFHYSGRAAERKSGFVLVPTTVALTDAAALDAESWRLQDVSDVLTAHDSEVLMFIDACHAGGLPPEVPDVPLPTGKAFLALACAPGLEEQAGAIAESTGFSPFTEALLAHIATKDQELADLMVQVGADMLTATTAQQVPLLASKLPGPFYFASSGEQVTSVVPNDAPQFEFAVDEVTLIAAPPAAGRAFYARTARLPSDMPRAVQAELKRVGCYGNAVDGDWGKGSQAAMQSYYRNKKAEPGDLEPTEIVYRALLAEPAQVCAPSAEPPPKKKKPSGGGTASTTKPAKTAPSKPAAAPKKPGVKCTFMVVAVVCK